MDPIQSRPGSPTAAAGEESQPPSKSSRSVDDPTNLTTSPGDTLTHLTDEKPQTLGSQHKIDDSEDEDPFGEVFLQAARLLERSYLQGDLDAREQAKGLFQQLLDVLPSEHRLKAASYTNLGQIFGQDFEVTGDVEAFSRAIYAFEQALRLRPVGHESRGLTLLNGAKIYMAHFQRFGDEDSFKTASKLQIEAIESYPPGHPHHTASIMVLSDSMKERGDQWAIDSESRDLVLSNERYLLELHPFGHPKHVSFLNRLGCSLESCFRITGDFSYIDEALVCLKEAAELAAPEHPSYSGYLSNYASALMSRCQNTSDLEALAEAVRMLREVLRIHGPDSSRHVWCIVNLANALMTQWDQVSDPSILDEVISLRRQALTLSPPGSQSRFLALVHLARDLKRQFEEGEDLSILAESIRLYREALPLRHGQKNDPELFSSLANALSRHIEHYHDPGTVTEVIELHQDVLRSLPPGHQKRYSSLVGLATIYASHTQLFPDGNAQAVRMLEEALQLLPEGHPRRFITIANLGKVLGGMEDPIQGHEHPREDGIRILRQALHDCPAGHPVRVGLLSNLATIFSVMTTQGMKGGEDAEAQREALELFQQELELQPEGHPDRQSTCHWIATTLLVPGPRFSWSDALDYIRLGIAEGQSSARRRVKNVLMSMMMMEFAAMKSALFDDDNSYLLSWPALDLYQQVVDLLPRAAHFGLDTSSRLRELTGTDEVTRNAAARAIMLGIPHLAVELFDAGKTVFWQQALRIQSPGLETLPPHDRDQLLRLFSKLHQSEAPAEEVMSKVEFEQQMEQRRVLGAQIEQFIDEIRKRPDHEYFMKPLPFRELIHGSGDGVVVLLLSTWVWTYAVIIPPEGKIKTVALSVIDSKLERIAGDVRESGMRYAIDDAQQEALNRLGMHKSIPKPKTTDVERIITEGMSNGDVQNQVLAELWTRYVSLVIEALGLQKSQGRDRPRLYWCPTGNFTFMPLHAAGIYTGDNQVCLSDYVVSSYIPSLAALKKARENWAPVPRELLKALLVAESAPPGMEPLSTVEEEIGTVACLLESVSAHVSNDLDAVPTAQGVLDHAPAAHILHLACHGQQREDPLQSRFVLRDGSLTITQLMKAQLPNAVLAFLSACETAKGDKDQPDQAVHLAASMLFCGFRSVIATMWSMHDMDGPEVTQWFYETLLEKESIDLDDIPYALDEAIRRLRCTGASPSRWATFIHVGA